MNVYLDNAATTRVYPEVAKAVQSCFQEEYGNPSSLYELGRGARDKIDYARQQIAKFINCSPEEIYFTSCGTESDNWVLKAMADCNPNGHIVTTMIEHKAILNTCKWLEEHGYTVTYLEPDERGIITPDQVDDAINENTFLVSVMAANNEIGMIEPIEEIGKVCQERSVPFHTDAVQAYGHIPIDVKAMHLNYMSVSGHKFHAPKGTGFLYAKGGVIQEPFMHGGGQENGLRAGTENVVGIYGMGVATKIISCNFTEQIDRMTALRDRMINRVLDEIQDCGLNGPFISRNPNNVSLWFDGINADTAVAALDTFGIQCSSGSACNTSNSAPSHVLSAIGRGGVADCTLRFTLSDLTTKEQIDYAVDVLNIVIPQLRKSKVS